MPLLKVFWYDSTSKMNLRPTDGEAELQPLRHRAGKFARCVLEHFTDASIFL